MRDLGPSVDDDFSCIVLEVSDLRGSFALALQAVLKSLEILQCLLLSLSSSFLLLENGLIDKLLTLISFHFVLSSKPGLLDFLSEVQRNLFLQLNEPFLLSLYSCKCFSLADMTSSCSFLFYFLYFELILSIVVIFSLSSSHLHC